MDDAMYEIVKDKLDRLIDGGYPNSEIFDELCNLVDDNYMNMSKGVIPYVRIFWHEDSDSDLDNVCDELLDFAKKWKVTSYCVIESCELDATIVVALTKRNGDDDE